MIPVGPSLTFGELFNKGTRYKKRFSAGTLDVACALLRL